MGFGTLFIGLFLLLNIFYYGFTDLIAALIILLAIYKLWRIDGYFRLAAIPTALLGVLGCAELILEMLSVFGGGAAVPDFLSALRYLVIGTMLTLLLSGIKRTGAEVEAGEVTLRAKIALPLVCVIFTLGVILELPQLTSFIDSRAIVISATVFLIILFLTLCYALYTVYTAYRWICMPEDRDNDVQDKPSRFGFVNRFRERQEEKRREYAEYKLESFKKSVNKTKKRKGKKK